MDFFANEFARLSRRGFAGAFVPSGAPDRFLLGHLRDLQKRKIHATPVPDATARR
jgi:hypothetical protein